MTLQSKKKKIKKKSLDHFLPLSTNPEFSTASLEALGHHTEVKLNAGVPRHTFLVSVYISAL